MKTLVALIAGVAAGLGANWLLQGWLPHMRVEAVLGDGSTSWLAALHGSLLAVSWLLPGFVTGMIAGRNGIVLGLTTGLMLGFLSLFVTAFFVLKSGAPAAPMLGSALHAVVRFYLPVVICSAIAGGCAQNLGSGGARSTPSAKRGKR